MTEETTPREVGSNDRLGLEPERAAFEAWFSEDGRYPQAVERSGNGYKLMSAHSAWTAWRICWSVAQSAERERCANLCEQEICTCCWDDDAQEAAEHLAAEIRKGPNARLSGAGTASA